MNDNQEMRRLMEAIDPPEKVNNPRPKLTLPQVLLVYAFLKKSPDEPYNNKLKAWSLNPGWFNKDQGAHGLNLYAGNDGYRHPSTLKVIAKLDSLGLVEKDYGPGDSLVHFKLTDAGIAEAKKIIASDAITLDMFSS